MESLNPINTQLADYAHAHGSKTGAVQNATTELALAMLRAGKPRSFEQEAQKAERALHDSAVNIAQQRAFRALVVALVPTDQLIAHGKSIGYSSDEGLMGSPNLRLVQARDATADLRIAQALQPIREAKEAFDRAEAANDQLLRETGS